MGLSIEFSFYELAEFAAYKSVSGYFKHFRLSSPLQLSLNGHAFLFVSMPPDQAFAITSTLEIKLARSREQGAKRPLFVIRY
jgi:hypothetical protein